MEPETSVILPVRSGARFVVQAIISVLEQLGDDDELLVVDDGSTDETPAIVAEIAIIASTGSPVVAAASRRPATWASPPSGASL
jgi:glycosyltransferase involved in cell wall biosynthesis